MTSDSTFGRPRAERHPASYDYRARFPVLELVGAAEGGVVYAGQGPEGYAVITDEGTLGGLLQKLDGANVVTVYLFANAEQRDRWVQERGWPPPRS